MVGLAGATAGRVGAGVGARVCVCDAPYLGPHLLCSSTPLAAPLPPSSSPLCPGAWRWLNADIFYFLLFQGRADEGGLLCGVCARESRGARLPVRRCWHWEFWGRTVVWGVGRACVGGVAALGGRLPPAAQPPPPPALTSCQASCAPSWHPPFLPRIWVFFLVACARCVSHGAEPLP